VARRLLATMPEPAANVGQRARQRCRVEHRADRNHGTAGVAVGPEQTCAIVLVPRLTPTACPKQGRPAATDRRAAAAGVIRTRPGRLIMHRPKPPNPDPDSTRYGLEISTHSHYGQRVAAPWCDSEEQKQSVMIYQYAIDETISKISARPALTGRSVGFQHKMKYTIVQTGMIIYALSPNLDKPEPN